LRDTGPVNQLFGIIHNLDFSKFEPYVITLSDEPVNSKINFFRKNGITVKSLELDRVQYIYKGRKCLRMIIKKYSPGIIQTAGIRADFIVANMGLSVAHYTTIRANIYKIIY